VSRKIIDFLHTDRTHPQETVQILAWIRALNPRNQVCGKIYIVTVLPVLGKKNNPYVSIDPLRPGRACLLQGSKETVLGVEG